MSFKINPLSAHVNKLEGAAEPLRKQISALSSEKYQEMLRKIVCDVPPLHLTSDYSALDMAYIASIVQRAAIPAYKVPMRNSEGDTDPIARGTHATMHCSRATIWTQVFASIYELILLRERVEPILTALAGAFHDAGREGHGPDLWEQQSADLLNAFLHNQQIPAAFIEMYVQAIKEKDPKDDNFSTDVQRIVHDADCIEIIRVRGRDRFNPNFLCVLKLAQNEEQRAKINKFLEELKAFILLTEKQEIKECLEFESQDCVGDIVRLLYQLREKFPEITSLMQEKMREILKTESNDVVKKMLDLIRKEESAYQQKIDEVTKVIEQEHVTLADLGSHLSKFEGSVSTLLREVKSAEHCITRFFTFLEQSKESPESVQQALKDILRIMKFFDKDSMHVFDARLTRFFAFVNDTLPMIQERDPDLARELKVCFSLLACPGKQSDFPHIYTSATSKRELLFASLEKEEKELVDIFCSLLDHYHFTETDRRRLAKLLGATSGLHPDNRDTLRSAFLRRLTCVGWEDQANLREYLEEFKGGDQNIFFIEEMLRLTKAKSYLQKQKNLATWYHATQAAKEIITSKQIEVRHEGRAPGAWLSDRREPSFGDDVLGFDSSILQVDQERYTGILRASFKRWRGLQKPIPATRVVIVGVQKLSDKAASWERKDAMRQVLQQAGLSSVTVVSTAQVDFLQKRIQDALYNPRSAFEFPSFQAALHRKMIQTPLYSLAQDQAHIAKLLQSSVLDLYRLPLNTLNVDKIQKGVIAREHFGVMPCVRSTLVTNAILRMYEQILKRDSVDPLFTSLASAFRHSAREAEFEDPSLILQRRRRRNGRGGRGGERRNGLQQRKQGVTASTIPAYLNYDWHRQSGELLNSFLIAQKVPEEKRALYVRAITEKNPQSSDFSSDIQKIVHDSGCIDFYSIGDGAFFDPSNLFVLKLAETEEQKDQTLVLLEEMKAFIQLTEKNAVKLILEHESGDAYGDLVRLLFKLKSRFPQLTELMKEDMSPLLATDSNPVVDKLLSAWL